MRDGLDFLRKFLELKKVDEVTHRVYGLACAEREDSDREICDYPAIKKAYEEWSSDTLRKTKAAGQEDSLGNIRLQHKLDIGGKATKIEAKDSDLEIWIESEPVNDEVWKMLKGGFLTGYSQEGRYTWRKCNTCGSELPRQAGANFCSKCRKNVTARYGSTISSVSYVDRPAQPDATFTYVRADGTQEMRKFATVENPLARLSEDDVNRIVHALNASIPTGEVTAAPMEKAAALLRELGVEDSELDTSLAKFSALVSELVGKHTPVKGGEMNKEQIAKCAKALGITEAEFTTQFVEGDALAKGAKGLAALGAHLKKAMAHHEKMAVQHEKLSAMHKAAGEMHDTMGEHLKNAMAAHAACQDDGEAEKILKALAAPVVDPPAAAAVAAGPDEAKVADMIKAAVEKGIKDFKDSLPADDDKTRRVLTIPRAIGEVKKADSNQPIPV